MVDFVITADELRSAPQPVRDWFAAQLFGPQAATAVPPPAPAEARESTLAALTTEEATHMLDLLRGDFLAYQVFFELGREGAEYALQRPAAHRIALADILKHTRLADLDHLAACLDAITIAFRQVRQDPSAMLFAVYQRGGLYVHEGTRKSIKALWQTIVSAQLQGAQSPGIPDGPTMPIPRFATE